MRAVPEAAGNTHAVSPFAPLSPAERADLLLHIEAGRLIVQTPEEAEDWFRRRQLEEAMSEAIAGAGEHRALAALHAALAQAQGEFPPIGKSRKATVEARTGRGYQYGYADLADVLDAVRPILSRHGLAVTQRTDGADCLITELRHAEGGVLASVLVLRPTDTWQQFGSGLSYARRYELCALLGIQPADEDDDGAGSEDLAGKSAAPAGNGKPDPAPQMITAAQHKKIGAQIGELTEKWPGPSWADRLREEFEVRSRNELTTKRASEAIEWLQQHIDHVPELKSA